MKYQFTCTQLEHDGMLFKSDHFDSVIHQKYFRTFIRSLIKAEEQHLFECNTSKMCYLIAAYRRMYFRSFPHQRTVERNIRRLQKTIAGEFTPLPNPLHMTVSTVYVCYLVNNYGHLAKPSLLD